MSNYEGICANCVHYVKSCDDDGDLIEKCYLTIPAGLVIMLELSDKIDPYMSIFPTKAKWTCSFGEEIKED